MYKKYIIMFITVIALFTSFNVISKFFRFKSFKLNFEPDGIFCSPYTNDLFILYKESLTVINSDASKKKYSIDIDVSSIYPSYDEIWMIDRDNNLYCCDNNYENFTFILSNVIDFSVYRKSYAAVLENGDLYVWGENLFYMLGVGENENVESPIYVDYMQDIKKCILGNRYSVVLDKNGIVYECGLLDYEIDMNLENKPICVSKFQVIDELSQVKNIESFSESIAIDESGKVYYWSNGFLSNKKHITNLMDLSEIASICNREKIESFSFGGTFCFGLNDNGDVYYWGEDVINKSSSKDINYVLFPTRIPHINDADTVFAGINVGYVKKGNEIFILKNK